MCHNGSMFTYFSTNNTHRSWKEVTELAVRQGFILDDGERVLESFLGYRTIAVPTGGTRQFFGGVTCDTFDRHEVITTGTPQGVIIGVKGDRIVGGRAAIRRW